MHQYSRINIYISFKTGRCSDKEHSMRIKHVLNKHQFETHAPVKCPFPEYRTLKRSSFQSHYVCFNSKTKSYSSNIRSYSNKTLHMCRYNSLSPLKISTVLSHNYVQWFEEVTPSASSHASVFAVTINTLYKGDITFLCK